VSAHSGQAEDGRVNPSTVPTVSVAEISPLALILDVREPQEWQAGHIATALHVPMNEVPNRVAYQPEDLDPARPCVVVCRSGHRSAHVTAWLNQHGFDAVNLDGGMLAWAATGRAMISETGQPPYVA
jgi:rhodanese-related sulfurtransferase